MWRTLLALLLLSAGEVAAQPAPAAHDPLDALLAHTHAIAKEVARVRGLPLKHEIAEEVVDRAELKARLAKLASDHKTAAETHAEGVALQRWGLVPLDMDYAQELVDLMGDQIAGYYDPDTKKLTLLRGAADTDPTWAEMVLAHELDHGLQDQSFDLHKFEDVPDSEADEALARHALVEGDGIALMIEVLLARRHMAAPWSDPEVATRLVDAMGAPTGDVLDKAPLVMREELLFPYRAGFAFVAHIRRRLPWSAVDRVFRHPPRSTEQIMHPDKYDADERPIPVTAQLPAALSGWTIAQQTVWGELGFQVFLRAHHVADAKAIEAAAGWGGDRVVLLEHGGDDRADHAIGLARFAWDTEIDAIEAERAAVQAMDDAVVGARLEHDADHTTWLALDGTTAFVERRGTSLVLGIGVPAWAAAALRAQAWTALTEGQAKR